MNFTKTKKVIAAGLSALMMMTSTTSVFAAESGCGDDLSWLEPGYNGPSGCVWPSGGSGDKSANLNYQVSSSYDWIIHSSIDFGADAGVKHTVDRTGNQVKVLKNVIPEGKYLNISVKGSGANDAFTVDNGGSEVLNYNVSDDNGAVGVNGNVLSVPAGTNTATQNMGFKLNTTKKSAEVAGNYNGHVIYNAEVGEKKKEKSSTIIGTVWDGSDDSMPDTQFANAIPEQATAVVFTDEVAPEGTATTDLTVAKDNGVVGWLDGTTWKVSTQDSKKAVTFNENCVEMFVALTDEDECNPNKLSRLTRISFDNVDTSNVTNMYSMFAYCLGLTSLDLSGFDTSNVTNMHGMFSDCSNLTSLDLSDFDTSNVTDTSYMFNDCSCLTSLDLSSFDTSNVTNMNCMFEKCKSLKELDLSSFDTFNVTLMHKMFNGCSGLKSLDLSSFDTSNVTNMNCMFYDCSSLASLDLSGFDTSNATDLSNMFHDCSNLASLDLRSFNTSKVTDMYGMFCDCSNLTSLDLSNFDTSKVTDMNCMLGGLSLTSLDLSNFDTSNVTNIAYMFMHCSGLTNIYVGPKWSTKKVTYGSDMFMDCKKLPNFNDFATSFTYAHTGPDGYLTLKQ